MYSFKLKFSGVQIFTLKAVHWSQCVFPGVVFLRTVMTIDRPFDTIMRLWFAKRISNVANSSDKTRLFTKLRPLHTGRTMFDICSSNTYSFFGYVNEKLFKMGAAKKST